MVVVVTVSGERVLEFELHDTATGASESSTETPYARGIHSVDSLRVYIWEMRRVAPAHQRLLLDTTVIRGESLRAAGVEDGSVITLVVGNHVQVFGGRGAFAALLFDGSVVTWGFNIQGHDSRRVEGQLTDVKEIITNYRAMAALKYDGTGTAVSWGHVGYVPELDGCEGFAGTTVTFAAINRSGCVVTWGDEYADCAPWWPLSLQLQDDVQALTRVV